MATLCREAALGPIRDMSFGDIEHIAADQVVSHKKFVLFLMISILIFTFHISNINYYSAPS